MTDETPKVTRKRERSPSFPIISVEGALQKLQQFEATFGRHPAPYKKVGMAWGVTEGSSQANQLLAAVKAYGFVEYSGSGDGRMVSISDTGRTYLRAQQEHIKEDIVREAALKPKAFAKFWPEWGADRPIDAICLDALVLEHSFNDNAAPTFLRVYDETIAYAKLGNSDKSETDDEKVDGPVDISVGDMIQWTSDGVDQFATPAKVLGIDGDWVFTDQSTTGISIREVTIMSNAAESVVTPPEGPPVIPPHLIPGIAPQVAPEASLAGSVVLSSGKVKETSFEVRVTGNVNQRVIARIIGYLEMAKDDYEE